MAKRMDGIATASQHNCLEPLDEEAEKSPRIKRESPAAPTASDMTSEELISMAGDSSTVGRRKSGPSLLHRQHRKKGAEVAKSRNTT